MLPSAKQTVTAPWTDFDGAKSSYDQIIPFVTTMQTVRKLGFDPYKTANMKVLNQAQVVNAVLPSPLQSPATIPKGISDCMRMQDGCVGYLMEPSKIDQKREGNFLLDFLNFKRNTVTTGWKFSALIVVIDGTVVYKQWDGQPKIETTDARTNPLGPLQSMGETLKVSP
ncbi:MAG: hypothetical protein P4L88_00700 [Rhodoferax sp.]|nr:hypothetical protein [Rhodoferax sp.]